MSSLPTRHLRFADKLSTALSLLVLLFAITGAQQARAGLFDDEEARRQVKDMSIKTNERLDTLSKAQIDLVNQIQALRDENARLRGQVETLTYELDSAKKRQQDFYVDLDGRLRKLETPPTPATESNPSDAANPPATDEHLKKEPFVLQSVIVVLVVIILAVGIWPDALQMLFGGRL